MGEPKSRALSLVGGGRPRTAATPAVRQADQERALLGRALEARLDEVAPRIAERAFPGQDLDLSVFATSVLGVRIIARWLIGGDGVTTEEKDTLAEVGQTPLLGEQSFGDLAKSHLAWRDVTWEMIRSECVVLDISTVTEQAALAAVATSADASLVRMCRKFDKTRAQLEALVEEERIRLAHQALHDQLTKLPNRVNLLSTLDRRRLAAREGAALLFVDLDHFKSVNDRFGHLGGDELLVTAAQRMRQLVREPDVVARFAGDEFVVLAFGLSDPPAQAAQLAERLRVALAEPFTVAGHHVKVSASVGVAVCGSDEDPEAIIERADCAMYHAKSQGRDRCETYTPILGSEAERRSALRLGLGMALSGNELSLHYQPVLDAKGSCVGAEALLRWSHPGFGSVSPAEFIPVAEETGLIVGIGDWVLQSALAQCAAWRRGGWDDALVSVNLSTAQLSDGIVPRVGAALAEAGLPPDALILEITETALMQDGPEALACLEDLRELGVGLAIDDFGTGYASLAYLRRLPVSYLKIDRSFTRDIHSPAKDSVIVRATIDLGHALGLKVIAEGVETPADRDALCAMGCDQLQGYLLGRPVPSSEFSWRGEPSMFE